MFKASSLAVTGKIGSILATYLFYLVAARTLGPTESGYFFLSFTLVTLLAICARAGLDVFILKSTAKVLAYNEDSRPIFYKYALISLVVSSALALACNLFSIPMSTSLFRKTELAPTLEALSAAIVFLSSLWLISKYFQGLGMIFTSEFFATGSWTYCVLAFTLLLSIETSNTLALTLTLSSGAFCLIGILTIILRPLKSRIEKPKRSRNSNTFHEFSYLWLSTFFTQVLTWSSTLIAGVILSADGIAILNVAQRTSMITAFPLIVANALLAPRFAALFLHSNMKGFIKLSDQSLKYTTAFALLIFTGIALLPDQIMALFGRGFQNDSGILVILAIGQLASVTCGSVQNMLTMTGNGKAVLRSTAYTVLVSITLSVSLTYAFGLWGAALSTMLSIVLLNLLLTIQVKKCLGFITFSITKR